MWYRRGEEPFMHIHTNFQRNWTNNANFTAHLIRTGPSRKSDNFIAWRHRSHTQIVQRWESIPCGANACLYGYPHAVYQSLDPDLGQSVPLFLKESHVEILCMCIEACGGHTRYWFSSLDNAVCVWSVCRKLWNCHIKCAVKLTLFVQFRWKLVWMCMNGTES